jgi:flagellin
MSVINTNLNALVAQESSRASGLKLGQSMERLSTGSKINSAKDDAAGLAISNRMTSQVRGYAKAIQNTNDAISMSQTAEGAFSNVSEILQRMRELAVQSSSGTNNDGDRANLQLEVAQLKSQIDDIATKTHFNNIKLLDGTAQKVTIQTGVNAGDNMTIGFASAQTKDIGIGTKTTLSSTGGTYAAGSNFSALTASTLYLNGVAVGASFATDDNASSAEGASSAIAKAAAINRVASLSGVYAKAGPTSVSGTSMTAAATGPGTITINGVATDSFSVTADAATSRKLTVAAINAKSALTGVTATDTGDDVTGVTLTAADGRNIDIAFGTLTAATTGVKGTSTNVGAFDLFTLDGRSITVDTTAGANAAMTTSGLRAGTYKADTATYTSFARTATTAATAPTSAVAGLLTSSSMIINGVAIGAALTTDDTASDVTATSSTRATSAIAIAAAINRSSAQSGVTATAAPNILRGSSFTAPAAGASTATSMYLNGQTISIVNNQTLNGVIDSVNRYSGLTGVVASQWGNGMQLTAADGRNISIGSTAGVAQLGLTDVTIGTAGTATASVTYTSNVTLSSDNAFTVKAGTNGVTNLENLGFRQGTFGGSDTGMKINQVDVSTSSGSTQALIAIDAAINTISKAQATSGAINNRLDAVINNLTESNQNISASRSRILDTDYATETTNLAKQQIISQAATAMLAQANQQSQSVLSLLK